MTVKPLLVNQNVTTDGKKGSRELIEVIAMMARKINELEKRIEALEP